MLNILLTGGAGKLGTELVKHFRRPLTSLRGESFNMGAEVQIGMNWQPESQSNPNGMKNVNI